MDDKDENSEGAGSENDEGGNETPDSGDEGGGEADDSSDSDDSGGGDDGEDSSQGEEGGGEENSGGKSGEGGGDGSSDSSEEGGENEQKKVGERLENKGDSEAMQRGDAAPGQNLGGELGEGESHQEGGGGGEAGKKTADASRGTGQKEDGGLLDKAKTKLKAIAKRLSQYFGVTVVFGMITGLVILGYSISYRTSSPSGHQCYYQYNSPNMNTQTNTVELNSQGYYVVGPYPTSLTDIGQTTQWYNTGFITDGNMLQVRVANVWYPWGKDGTATIENIKPVMKNDGSLFTNSQGVGSVAKYFNAAKPVMCSFSTDISEIPQDSLYTTRSQNQLMRYYGSTEAPTPVEDQIEYIMGVQCLEEPCSVPVACSGTTVNPNSTTCYQPNNQRAPDNTEYTTCAMNYGHGVYLKIGEITNYAWHLANYEIIEYALVYKDGNYISQEVLNPNTGKPASYYVPFSLPSMIRNPNYPVGNIPNLTTTDPSLYLANEGNTTTTQFANQYECDTATTSFVNQISETCNPPAGQAIYLAVDDTYYMDNQGTVQVTFESGAQPLNPMNYVGGSTSPPSYSFMQNVVARIMTPLFGPQNYSTMPAGALIDFTNDDQGLVIFLRNGLLANQYFQVMRFLSIMIMVTLYGYGVMMGKIAISLNDLSKRVVKLGFAYWGTDPTNYTLIDDFIVPILYYAIPELGGVLMSMAASINGFSISPDNPWSAFDILLQGLYGPTVGYKFLALFQGCVWFWLTGLILFYTMLIFTASIFKVFFATLIGVMLSAMSISILPILFLLMLNDYTAKYFDNWFQGMIKQMLQTMFFLFVMMVFYSFAYMGFFNIINFTTCWEELLHLSFGLILNLGVWGWSGSEALGFVDYMKNLIWFILGTYLCTKGPDLIAGPISSIFGGLGFYSSGMAFKNTLAESAFEVVNHVIPARFDGAIAEARSIIKDPTKLASGITKAMDKAPDVARDVASALGLAPPRPKDSLTDKDVEKATLSNAQDNAGETTTESTGRGRREHRGRRGRLRRGGGIRGEVKKLMGSAAEALGMEGAADVIESGESEGRGGEESGERGLAKIREGRKHKGLRGAIRSLKDVDKLLTRLSTKSDSILSADDKQRLDGESLEKLAARATSVRKEIEESPYMQEVIRDVRVVVPGTKQPESRLSLDNDKPTGDPTVLTSGIENATITGVQFSTDNTLAGSVTGNTLSANSITNPDPDPKQKDDEKSDFEKDKEEMEAKAMVKKEKMFKLKFREALNELELSILEAREVTDRESTKFQDNIAKIIAAQADVESIAKAGKIRVKSIEEDDISGDLDESSERILKQSSILGAIASSPRRKKI